jgi:hypothetical protein
MKVVPEGVGSFSKRHFGICPFLQEQTGKGVMKSDVSLTVSLVNCYGLLGTWASLKLP